MLFQVGAFLFGFSGCECVSGAVIISFLFFLVVPACFSGVVRGSNYPKSVNSSDISDGV